MSLARGIDISAWQGLPSRNWFAKAREAGFEIFIAQLWGGGPGGGLRASQYAEEQLRRAEEAGFEVLGGYIVLPPDDDWRTGKLIQTAARAAGSMARKLSLVALDLEIPKRLHPACPVVRLLDALFWLSVHFPGAVKMIYTAPGVWRQIMGADNPWPGDRPPCGLWEARWIKKSGEAPEDTPSVDSGWQAFGGWDKRAGLQYAGNVRLFCVTVDLNVFDRARLHGLA